MYRVKGADQKEYGPVTAEQVRQWIQEGRLNRYSLLQKEGDPAWKPMEQHPEFGDLLVAAPPSTVGAPAASGAGGGSVAGVIADPQRAASQLKVPAILILVLAGVGAVLSVAGLFIKGAILEAVLNAGIPFDPNIRTQLEQSRAAGIGVSEIFQAVLGLGINVLVIVGALKMLRLQSWGLAMTAAILIMLPCSGCCCLLGLPVGIWALVTLNKPEIKGAFR